MNQSKKPNILNISLLSAFFLFTMVAFGAAETSSYTNSHAENFFMIGKDYYNRHFPEKAAECYRKAAVSGDVRAMNNLGILLIEGLGVKSDVPEGLRWIRKAAAGGNPNSAFMLGSYLIEGKIIPHNQDEGMWWIRKAADDGYLAAVTRIAQDTYFGDEGITKDLDKAFPLVKKSADGGSAWGCRSLAVMLAKGEGVQPDQEKAKEWMLKGATAPSP